jgi:hypothetical protein
LGLKPGEGTLARLDVGGRSFYGINAHGRPISLRTNAITRTHAEADAFQQAADALLRFDPKDGMFDASYAAAWEMGRLLTLQSKKVSVALYQWKRQAAQTMKAAAQRASFAHLPRFGVVRSSDASAVPAVVQGWFQDLNLLKQVPFNYLLPDERLLPPESIRFFQVDPLWVRSLLDGAYAVGRSTPSDCGADGAHGNSPAIPAYSQLSGFLLRSQIVSGWPGLLFEGYSEIITDQRNPSSNRLPVLRQETLAPNVLICIYLGSLGTVDFHLKPETLHFGLDDDGNAGFCKQLRNSRGVENMKTVAPIPWTNQGQRVVDVGNLAKMANRPTNPAFPIC